MAAMSLISACGKNKKDNTLSSGEVELVLSKKQDKPFSLVNLPSASEKEATDTLKDKCDLSITNFYKESIKNFKDYFKESGMEYKDPIFRINGQSNKVSCITFLEYSNTEIKDTMYGHMEAIYTFDSDENETRLYQQTFEVITENADFFETLSGIETLLKKEAENMKIENVEKVITNYQKLSEKTSDELSGKQINLYDDSKKAEKDKGVARTIYVSFDFSGKNNGLGMIIKDYSGDKE